MSPLSFLLLLPFALSTTLDQAKFHCIEYNSTTLTGVFRSNMPITPGSNSTATPESYAYDDILEYASKVGTTECGTDAFAAPSSGPSPYILELSLSNSLDDKNGLLASRAFWSKPENFEKGRLVEMPIGVAGLVPPSLVPKFKWENISGSMWEVDQVRE